MGPDSTGWAGVALFTAAINPRAGRWGPATAVQCAVTGLPAWQSSQPGQVGNQAALTVESVPGVRLVNFFSCLRAVFQPLASPPKFFDTVGRAIERPSQRRAPLPDSRMNLSISSSVETMVWSSLSFSRSSVSAASCVRICSRSAAICVCRSAMAGPWEDVIASFNNARTGLHRTPATHLSIRLASPTRNAAPRRAIASKSAP